MVNFLIVRPDKMGDAIITQVILEALYKTVPCNIDVFASNYNYRYYEDNPYIRNIFYCDMENKSQMYAKYKDVCRSIDYDAVFILQTRRRLQKMALLGKCKQRFGFNLAFDYRFSTRVFEWIITRLFNFHYTHYNLDEHEMFNLKNLINCGLEKLKLPPLVTLANRCNIYSKAIQDALKLPKSIIINISGKHAEHKIILPSMLTSLLLLLTKSASKISIIALADDRVKAEEILKMLNFQYPQPITQEVEIISATDVFTIANIMNKYEYYIGADGGLLHIATGLGMKCVGLYDDYIRPRWYPWTPYQVTLSSEISYEISPVAVMNALETLGYK
jgi:ADP-heptose:LPS heptosyltransferase